MFKLPALKAIRPVSAYRYRCNGESCNGQRKTVVALLLMRVLTRKKKKEKKTMDKEGVGVSVSVSKCESEFESFILFCTEYIPRMLSCL